MSLLPLWSCLLLLACFLCLFLLLFSLYWGLKVCRNSVARGLTSLRYLMSALKSVGRARLVCLARENSVRTTPVLLLT